MADELVYNACLEVRPSGACVAQLIDLPACFAFASDARQALADLEASIPAYFEWLSRHDEYTPVMHGPFRAVAAETVTVEAETLQAFFASDAQPLTVDDLDWFATLLDWSYADYQEIFASRANDPAAQQAALTLSQRQSFLLSRLSPSVTEDVLTRQYQPDLIASIRRDTLARLRGASEDERTRVIELPGERWSLRKVLRRSIMLVRAGAQSLGAS
jgi:hypothetical protein